MVTMDAAVVDAPTTSDGKIDTRVTVDTVKRDTTPGDDGGTDATPTTDGPTDTGPLVWGAFGPISAPAQTMVEIALTSVPGAGTTIAQLNADTDPEARVPVIFKSGSYGMSASAPNGELKLRGASTRLANQKSYTVELTETEPTWEGTHTIFLNKHPYDLTRLRNKLSFDLFAAIPEMKTLRTAWVHLTIDGTDYGLFTQVEHAGPRFLRERGFGDGGLLYKAKVFEFVPLDVFKPTTDPTYDKDEFQKHLEIKGAKDHTRLLAMIAAVNNYNRSIDSVVDQYFDRKNYVTWLAVNLLTRNLDTTSQNFYLAARADSDVWTFVPWDYDGGWGFYEQPTEAGRVLPRWRSGLANWWAAVLHRRFLSVPANLKQFSDRVDQLATEFFTRDRIKALTDVYKPLVRAAINKAPDLSQLPSGPGDKMAIWEAEVDRLLTIIAAERTRFYDLLERPMPFFLGTPLVGSSSVMFNWDTSFDLQGDAVRYDLQISTTPDFATLAYERKDFNGILMMVNETLPAGTYYWRVIARDAKDPTTNWQFAFDSVYQNNTSYMGVASFTVP